MNEFLDLPVALLHSEIKDRPTGHASGGKIAHGVYCIGVVLSMGYP